MARHCRGEPTAESSRLAAAIGRKELCPTDVFGCFVFASRPLLCRPFFLCSGIFACLAFSYGLVLFASPSPLCGATVAVKLNLWLSLRCAGGT